MFNLSNEIDSNSFESKKHTPENNIKTTMINILNIENDQSKDSVNLSNTNNNNENNFNNLIEDDNGNVKNSIISNTLEFNSLETNVSENEKAENSSDSSDENSISSEENYEVSNCLALTVKKDYSMSVVKNVFVRTAKGIWKIAVSIFTLNIIKFFF